MYCLVCDKLINKVVTIKNIFKTPKDHICEYCFTKHLMINKLDVIPIDDYRLFVNSIFEDYDLAEAMMSFLKPYYIYYLKTNKNQIIMYFDTFNKGIYNIIKTTKLSDIYLICLKNEMEKEKDYED